MTNPKENLASWRPGDASRPYCTRPWIQLALLSDGTAVCSCVDAERTNPLGNLKKHSLEEVWNGPAMVRLRENIGADIDRTPICRTCPHRVAGPPPPREGLDRVPRPRVLFLESYGGCNLRCPGCNRSGLEGSREELTLDFALTTRVIDALSPELAYMEFHIGGENYMHPRADEMVRYCKDRNPECFILTSTNGHFFQGEERCRKVLASGIDAIIFSVDGARQESYERYRVKGRIDRVFRAMETLARLRDEADRKRPLLIWRYILFAWNDSTEEMEEARRRAGELGVDALAWHLNCVDSVPSSTRYHPGSPHLAEIEGELWDTLQERLEIDLGVDFASYQG